MKTEIEEIRKISGFSATSGGVRETDFNAQICATSNLSDEKLIHLMKAAPDLLEALEVVVDSGLLVGNFEIHDKVRFIVLDAINKATQP